MNIVFVDDEDSRSARHRVATASLTPRISALTRRIQSEPRRMSVEQALIITECYREHPDEPRVLQRAYALEAALRQIRISIDPDELIVGNRTAEVRAGVVFPEAGISWVSKELETLPAREQDPFDVRPEDARAFLEQIAPYWAGRTLEDMIGVRHGTEITAVKKVVKINQTDHAQGHICPGVEEWLKFGPSGLKDRAIRLLKQATSDQRPFYEAVVSADA